MSNITNITMGAVGAVALTATVQAHAAGNTDRKPNVVVILADDLGYGDLGCYGAKNVATPSIDALASAGVRFTNCHATAATSTPSRYALLTGEYAWRRKDTDVAAGNAGMIIRPEQFTMADLFKAAGYSTGAFGKWHLGLGDKTGTQDWNAPLPAALGDLGFDYSYIMAATADRVPCVFIENGQVANYDPSAPIEVNYHKNFPGEPTGKDNPELLTNQRPSHGHDQSIVNGISRIGYMKGGGKALWKDENIADSITSHAVDFIRANAGNPFFVYFATNDVHVPRFPHPRFRGASTMGVRGDAIAQFDWSVGRVLAELDSLGIADNTIVILTSDNGPVVDDGYEDMARELLNGHSPTGGLRGGKYSAFEGGTRVPFIVRWPGKTTAGQTLEALASQIDMLASFASLLNVNIPRGQAPDSYPRMDSFLGRDCTSRPWVVEQAYDNTIGIVTPEWKYIPPSKGPAIVPWGTEIETGLTTEPQLFKVSDVTELTNVAPANQAVVNRLSEILEAVKQNNRSELQALDALP
ncbi:MAG: arylsulfatase [Firmicutes bacterium]|nr:arylsulfatase [Bacillota bacterium]MCM1401798.1 arylsulfatase [Bacteroides sp.]MCM1477679.1 arylsulfatase [Bacteroides sp.]